MAGDTKEFTIPAGGTYPINGNGETYIFCQFADRPIKVKIAGKTVTMRAGGYQEFEPLGGPNARVEFENTDPDNPAAVIFILGTGTYDEKIVRGEISIEPILRSADGTTRADTRTTIGIDLSPSNLALTTYTKNDVVDSATIDVTRPSGAAFDNGEPFVWRGENDNLAFANLDTGPVLRVLHFDKGSMELVSQVTYPISGTFKSPTYRPGVGLLYLDTLPSPNRVRKTVAGGAVSTVKVLDDDNDVAVLWIPERNQYFVGSQSGNSKLYDGNWNLVKTLAISTDSGLGYDPENDWLIVGRQGNSAIQYDFDGNTMGTVGPPNRSGTLTTENGLYTLNGQDYYTNASRDNFNGGAVYLTKAAYVDYQTKPEFLARKPGCELAGAMIKPGRIPQVTANITATQLAEGVQLEGEIIKAAIEFYYKRKAPANYLDHVYYLDISRDAAGLPFKAISSGNATFDRANVADNFGVLTPAQIVLTVDNELELGVAI